MTDCDPEETRDSRGRLGWARVALCFLVGAVFGFLATEFRRSEPSEDLESGEVAGSLPSVAASIGPRRAEKPIERLDAFSECPVEFAELGSVASYFDGVVAEKSRFADVTGRVVDIDGKGVAGLSVHARPRAVAKGAVAGRYDAELARGGTGALVGALLQAAARSKDLDRTEKTTVTDAEGTFRFDKIRDQEWGIHVDPPDGTMVAPAPFEYPPPFRSDPIVISLRRVHRIPVVVRFDDGEIPQQAEVKWMSTSRKWTPQSPIIGFQEGTYALSAHAEGSSTFASATVTIPHPPGTPMPLPLVIPRVRHLSVRVSVAAGALSPRFLGLTVRALRRTGDAAPSDAEIFAKGRSAPVVEKDDRVVVAVCELRERGLYDVRLFESENPRSIGRTEVSVVGVVTECSVTMDDTLDPARFLTLRAVDENGATILDAFVGDPWFSERRIGRQSPDGTIWISREALSRYLIGADNNPGLLEIRVIAPNRGEKIIAVDRGVGERRVVFAPPCRLEVEVRLPDGRDAVGDLNVTVSPTDSDRTGNCAGTRDGAFEVLDARRLSCRFSALQPGRYDVALLRSNGDAYEIVDRVEVELNSGRNSVRLTASAPKQSARLEIDAPSLAPAAAIELRPIEYVEDVDRTPVRAHVDDAHRAVFESVRPGTYLLGDPAGEFEELRISLPGDTKVLYEARPAKALEVISGPTTSTLFFYGLSIGDHIIGCAGRKFTSDPLARLRRACKLQDEVVIEIARGSTTTTVTVPAQTLDSCLPTAFRRAVR
jgi:hypothetical protein